MPVYLSRSDSKWDSIVDSEDQSVAKIFAKELNVTNPPNPDTNKVESLARARLQMQSNVFQKIEKYLSQKYDLAYDKKTGAGRGSIDLVGLVNPANKNKVAFWMAGTQKLARRDAFSGYFYRLLNKTDQTLIREKDNRVERGGTSDTSFITQDTLKTVAVATAVVGAGYVAYSAFAAAGAAATTSSSVASAAGANAVSSGTLAGSSGLLGASTVTAAPLGITSLGSAAAATGSIGGGLSLSGAGAAIAAAAAANPDLVKQAENFVKNQVLGSKKENTSAAPAVVAVSSETPKNNNLVLGLGGLGLLLYLLV